MKKVVEKFVWQKELKSFIITFIVGFVMVIYTELDAFTLDSFRDGAYVGILFGAARSAVKGVIELFLSTYNK
jgi:Na+/H+ antiporter NhaA